jgi:uncharacterized membrane protein
MKYSLFLWIFSFLFTIAIAYYQRTTGPTYPVRGKVEFGGQEVKYRLIRSSDDENGAKVTFKDISENISGSIRYKRFKSSEDWTETPLRRDGANLIGILPQQPPAGKLEYTVTLSSGGETIRLSEEPIVIRYKGAVPAWVLFPHIIIMFFAMMMSTRTGLEALFKGKRSYNFAWITVVSLFVGGLILGPVVQKYAFDAFWTGWPFGQDLTDNKTLAAWLFWVFALWRLYKKPESRVWTVIAMVMLLAVYLIPHSMFGSELDYTTGEVNTGR